MDDLVLRAEKYRNKAEEIRTIAARLSETGARVIFLKIASDYLHMAETLERMAAAKEQRQSGGKTGSSK